ncbi:MAG TPA: bifunctional ornithine acetyltransferase/N-acetylglutamate synthase [Cellvibrionales bacterium]|jgi:glutamate N-acetyltransferase/amino-acid N-acetyltransferase|nr:bifunctional ornithine acetyltransferase/N-acetylglutamate synthase [Cellvibrionales bacterium]
MVLANPKLHILPVAGVRWGVAYAGIKSSAEYPSNDLALMELASGSQCAAVFTQNAFCAAPVTVAKNKLASLAEQKDSSAIYLLINSGNANAGTGDEGYRAAELSCQLVAESNSCDAQRVLPFSTGVIGQSLPVEKIQAVSDALNASLSTDSWSLAAEAIMTTDTVAKGFSRTIDVDGKRITVSGICKGAGMIRPNMATMLAYVATDAELDSEDLQPLLDHAVQCSFNRITVDGDTSTNDACVLAATGQAGVKLDSKHAAWHEFNSVLRLLFVDLATAIIRDAEGASKFITIDVKGGRSSAECLQVAYAVAESPLVKTAFFASDANWGRILAAVGRAGVEHLDVDAIEIYLDDLLICQQGGQASTYDEQQAMKIMGQQDISVTIDLQRGSVDERVWTSDLSLDYVHINADYRS